MHSIASHIPCTKHNHAIQKCKAWLLQYVALSSNRVGGLAKYLAALAASEPSQPTGSNPSPKRRRLHILYLLNDLLHHTKYHIGTTATFSTVSGSLQLHIVGLVGHAAACDRQKNPRHHRRLDDLLDIWSEHGYFNPEFVDKLREVVTNSASMGVAPLSNDADTDAKKPGKDTPFVVPSTHGDPSTPFYDIPAGNFIPHIMPRSTLPLQSTSVKPIQLLPGPADAELVQVLKDFFGHVDKIGGTIDLKDDDADINELGQSIVRDEITKDILDGETYYGWTRAFCQQMKKPPARSRSPSRSRSTSPTNFKRRRYSDSSYSPSDSRSPSRSRSHKRDVRRRHDSRSRSRSPGRSRESSYTPREPQPSHFPPPHQHQHQQQPQYPTAPNNPFPPPHNPNGQGHYSQQIGNAGYPPPPPQNYGSWPPPPPHMSDMPFPPPGPGVPQSAFPPPYQHPQIPMARGQGHPMPPGQYHFPPPYSGGQSGGGLGPPTGQGGRPWR